MDKFLKLGTIILNLVIFFRNWQPSNEQLSSRSQIMEQCREKTFDLKTTTRLLVYPGETLDIPTALKANKVFFLLNT